MKNTIVNLARKNMIDEIRFIEAKNLTDDFIGDANKFVGRQPKDLLESAETIIVFSVYIGKFVFLAEDDFGKIGRLCASNIYNHMEQPLDEVAAYLQSHGYKTVSIPGLIENGELPLKGIAVKAGLGWIGKNTLLVNQKYGSFQAFSAIITDAKLAEEYEVVENHCGKCTKCSEVCPAGAINENRTLNKEKCLTYILNGRDNGLSVYEDVCSDGFVVDCDICQNACPWNQKHIKTPLETPYGSTFDANRIRTILSKKYLQSMSREEYEQKLCSVIGYAPSYEVFQRSIQISKKKQ